jgi:general secretion pathway protein G
VTVRRLRGFTLLELLVVLLIIGLLTGIVAPRLMNQISRSETTTAKAQIDALDKAIQAFRIDVGRYPSSSEGLQVLVKPAVTDPRWRGPYLKDAVPLDPWGMPYVYAFPGTRGKDYDITSYGRDRAQGGSGEDADITN